MKVNRRTFVKSAAASCAAGVLISSKVSSAAADAVLHVIHGEEPAAMLAQGIQKFGGWGALIKKGTTVTLKPNAAWASLPEQGGNTDPRLVGACVRALKAAGAAKVIVPENPCSPSDKAFSLSGIAAAVKDAGGEMISLEDGKRFKTMSLPKGKILKSVEIATDLLNADFLINMPVVKSHGGCTITCSLKNWMGSVKDRRQWHSHGVDQCIVDFNAHFSAALIIADATRVMRTLGPQGPGDVIFPKQLIFGRDPVAVDAYAATLFDLKPFDIPHIKLAHDAGIGIGDLSRIQVNHLHMRG